MANSPLATLWISGEWKTCVAEIAQVFP